MRDWEMGCLSWKMVHALPYFEGLGSPETGALLELAGSPSYVAMAFSRSGQISCTMFLNTQDLREQRQKQLPRIHWLTGTL